MTGCKSILPASRAIFVCLLESVMAGDEIIMEIISFKILQNINPMRSEQIADPDHLPQAALVPKKGESLAILSFNQRKSQL